MYNYTSTNQGFTHLYQAHNTFDTFCFLICGIENLLTCKKSYFSFVLIQSRLEPEAEENFVCVHMLHFWGLKDISEIYLHLLP